MYVSCLLYTSGTCGNSTAAAAELSERGHDGKLAEGRNKGRISGNSEANGRTLMKKVIVACGNGVATSQTVAFRINRMLEKENITNVRVEARCV